MDVPPRLQKQKSKNLRFAATLNFLVPGAGQIYMGKYLFGGLLAVGFLGCLVGTLVIFVRGYVQYFQIVTNGDILSSDALEQLGTVFHVRLLVGLLVGATVLFIASLLGLYFTGKKLDEKKME